MDVEAIYMEFGIHGVRCTTLIYGSTWEQDVANSLGTLQDCYYTVKRQEACAHLFGSYPDSVFCAGGRV